MGGFSDNHVPFCNCVRWNMCRMHKDFFSIKHYVVDFKMERDSRRNIQIQKNTPGLEHQSRATICSRTTSLTLTSTSHGGFFPSWFTSPSLHESCQEHCQYLHMGYHQCIIWPIARVYHTGSMCFSAARSSSVLVYSFCCVQAGLQQL